MPDGDSTFPKPGAVPHGLRYATRDKTVRIEIPTRPGAAQPIGCYIFIVFFSVLCAIIMMPVGAMIGIPIVVLVAIAWLVDTLRRRRRALIDVSEGLLSVRSSAGTWQSPLEAVVEFSVCEDEQGQSCSLSARQRSGESRVLLVSSDSGQLNWIAARLNELARARQAGDSSSPPEL
jgi:hypothetical protein